MQACYLPVFITHLCGVPAHTRELGVTCQHLWVPPEPTWQPRCGLWKRGKFHSVDYMCICLLIFFTAVRKCNWIGGFCITFLRSIKCWCTSVFLPIYSPSEMNTSCQAHMPFILGLWWLLDAFAPFVDEEKAHDPARYGLLIRRSLILASNPSLSSWAGLYFHVQETVNGKMACLNPVLGLPDKSPAGSDQHS